MRMRREQVLREFPGNLLVEERASEDTAHRMMSCDADKAFSNTSRLMMQDYSASAALLRRAHS